MTEAKKAPNVKVIRIDSRDQQSERSQSDGSFTCDFKNYNPLQHVSGLCMIDAWVPNNFYNVRSSSGTPSADTGYANNVLTLLEGGQPGAVYATVAPGQYLLSEYIVALQASINAVLVTGTVAITQGALSKVLIFTFTATTAIFYSEIDDSTSTGAPTAGITITTTNLALITADSLPDLGGIKQAYIHSRDVNLSGESTGFRIGISVITSVDLSSTPFGGVAYRKFDSHELSSIDFKEDIDMSTISTRLRDYRGNILNPGSGSVVYRFAANC